MGIAGGTQVGRGANQGIMNPRRDGPVTGDQAPGPVRVVPRVERGRGEVRRDYDFMKIEPAQCCPQEQNRPEQEEMAMTLDRVGGIHQMMLAERGAVVPSASVWCFLPSKNRGNPKGRQT